MGKSKDEKIKPKTWKSSNRRWGQHTHTYIYIYIYIHHKLMHTSKLFKFENSLQD